jgi:hypothetical protein
MRLSMSIGMRPEWRRTHRAGRSGYLPCMIRISLPDGSRNAASMP